MRNSDWPLLIFTLLMQLAAGSILIITILNQFFGRNSDAISRIAGNRLALIIVPSIIVALLFSFTHLGNPKNSVLVLSNLGTSWLSREILFVMIFSFIAVAGLLMDYFAVLPHGLRTVIFGSASFSGVLLIFSMSKIYMLPTVPAWDSAYTPLSFFSTALFLGSVAVMSVYYFTGNSASDLFRAGYYFFITSGILCILIAALNLTAAQGSQPQLPDIILAAARIILIISVLYTGYVWYSNDSYGVIEKNMFLFIPAAAVISEIIGRYIFYASYARIGV